MQNRREQEHEREKNGQCENNANNEPKWLKIMLRLSAMEANEAS